MDLNLNADRFTGNKYISTYHQFRPKPPAGIIEQTLNYINKSEKVKVLDLGCGSGISTQIWKEYADRIIGCDPSSEMIEFATNKNNSSKIEYKVGFSHSIPMESESIDIISCSQSFHWMEPKSTLKEVNRVLKKDGVLVIYDVIWPPSVNYQYESAYNKLFETINRIINNLDNEIANKWEKNKHCQRIIQSNYFKFVKETYFHKSEKLSKDKLLGIAISQGGLEALLKRGFSKNVIGLDSFENIIENLSVLPSAKITFNYRVIYAVK